VTTMIIF